jgi:hypothetical protein
MASSVEIVSATANLADRRRFTLVSAIEVIAASSEMIRRASARKLFPKSLPKPFR